MFNELEIDAESLTYLHYHWLWGLRYSKTPQPVNLGAEVGKLLKDETKLVGIIEGQIKIYLDHNIMVRFFYWLFNINNYAYHAYLLVACKGHQNYLSRSLEKDTSMTTSYNLGWGILASGLVAGIGYASRRIYRFLIDPSNALVILQKATSAAQQDVKPGRTDIESVIVRASMLPHLKVLSIKLSLGDSLKLSDFKSIRNKRYLASHPDKQGGSKEEFRRVREAANSLIKIMSSRDHSRNMHPFKDDHDKYWGDFNAFLDELYAKFAETKAIRAETRAIRAETKAKFAEAEAIRAETKAIRDATKAEAAAVIKQLQEQMREQSLTYSPSFSTTGAPGLFAPEVVRVVETGAEVSNTLLKN